MGEASTQHPSQRESARCSWGLSGLGPPSLPDSSSRVLSLQQTTHRIQPSNMQLSKLKTTLLCTELLLLQELSWPWALGQALGWPCHMGLWFTSCDHPFGTPAS